MRLRGKLVLGLLAFSVAGVGCRGPKSSCNGTMDSFASIVDGQHWDDYPDIVYPPQRKKFGDKKIVNWIRSYYHGAKSFEFTDHRTSISGNVCLYESMASWDQKILGHRRHTWSGEGFTYILHKINGKWYVELPGASKVQGI